MQFLISQMWHQCDARLLDSFITTSLERRNKDNIRIGSHDNLCIEIALRTYLENLAVFHTL